MNQVDKSKGKNKTFPKKKNPFCKAKTCCYLENTLRKKKKKATIYPYLSCIFYGYCVSIYN